MPHRAVPTVAAPCDTPHVVCASLLIRPPELAVLLGGLLMLRLTGTSVLCL
jgi:hypothetical protein